MDMPATLRFYKDGDNVKYRSGGSVQTLSAGGSVNATQISEAVEDYLTENPPGAPDWGDIGGTLADQDDLNTALSGKAASDHDHNDSYYTELEVDDALGNKADSDHNHDTRYYTEDEVDALIAAIVPTQPFIILTKSSTVNQNIGGANNTEVWWTWDGEDYKDTDVYAHSTSVDPEKVYVLSDGWYRIRFIGQAQQGGSNRTTLQGIIRVNGGTTQRKGSIRDYTRGSGYGNASPGLECVMELSADDYIEIGTRVEDTDATYTIDTNGAEIDDDENILIIEKVA